MLFVPLLVGTAIVTVAIMSRVERSLARPETRVTPHPAEPGVSPLQTAFPHLEVWIPSDDLFRRAQAEDAHCTDHAVRGSIGPDIIVGPWTQSPRLRDDSVADAA